MQAYMPVYLKAWGLTFVIAGFELAGSILSGSFALLADVTHVFTDTVVGLGPVSVEFFRHRFHVSAERIEQTGGFLVSAILIFVGVHIIGEATEHISGGEHHEVEGGLMLIFAALAAATNFLQHRLLSRVSPIHRHAAHTGFHFHILTDLVKNILLPILAVLMLFGASEMLDVWAGYAIGWLIIVRAALLALESLFGKRIVQRTLDHFFHWIIR
ncbi:MAG: hypothetical protein A3C93_00285 [Candidatus Lloydbacteria bacterium RIFCSPHIGHO2_02_FULL_54_17]|uniref:Cation efflux protein transmembrane domain-containing protein n=1 Tax=Candidatus Lloydbacteria bacterium RIFCSPHIGHO2_02_FULL_54_17 TaxID=1798664 RepID=A0A1G2DG93_9BACT|nr:MAG: hypothetical protein A3C93_00285 [Candidatus Lloydbacteria bacterium RIFCSPHIGHO2_02_FULL_54_17]